MGNWTELCDYEYNEVWDKFYDIFKFNPSIYKENWPTYKEPAPFITYDISNIWGGHSFEEYQKLYSDLHEKVLMAFIECTSENEKIYALDWQHLCYKFDPRLKFETKIFVFADGDEYKQEDWYIPVLPNGDYYIFLAKDFSWGILGHPWEETMCIFGNKLVNSLNKNKPMLFSKVIKSSDIK